MKTKTVLALAIGISIFLSSCEEFGEVVTPSASITTETHTASGFTGIDVSHAFNVYVNFSEATESIEVEANENLHDHIIVEKQGNTLVVKMKDYIRLRMSTATLNVYITTAFLDNFTASGATDVVLYDVLKASDVYMDLSGASSLSGTIEADDLTCDLSGASDLDLSGSADYLSLNASGSSTVKDYVLSVNWLDADLSGASDAFLTVNERLDVEASGASSVHYRGSGTIYSQDLSGASSISKE